MNKQLSLSALSNEMSQVRTKKKEFLAQIERIVPWGEWIALIKPCYYKGERGNKPYDLELMQRGLILKRGTIVDSTFIEAPSSESKQEYAVVRLQFRFRKTRYRGLPKQVAKLNMIFALANLILADRPCLTA